MTRARPTRFRRRGALAAALLALAGLPSVAGDPPAVPAWRQASRIAVVTVHGEIDRVTAASLERRVSEAAASGANAAVLDLDTPGGDVAATLGACRWIKEEAPIPVWAWVHPQAYSAGTIIALACRGILVSPGAAFGDAAPIAALPGLGLQPLPAAERAKIEAPVLAEVVDSARRRGSDELLARCFVSAPEEAWLLERDDGAERILVSRAEYRDAFGADPPDLRGTAAAPASFEAGAPVVPFADLALRGGEDAAAGGADASADGPPAPRRARLAAGDGARWRLVTQVDGARELLVLREPEALGAGAALASVADDAALRAWFGATASERLDEHWGDALVRFLTSWPVRLVLVAVVLCGFLVEFALPGFGWFGGAATVALVLLLGSPALAGIADWWPLLLVALGAALVAIEVFVIPGTGIVGFLGAGCALVGLVAGLVDAPLGTAQGRSDLAAAIGIVAGGGILAAIGTWAVLKALPRTAVGHEAILSAAVGGTSAPGTAAHERVAPGTVGRASTPLRPSGKVEIGGTLHEAVAVGGMVEPGQRVVVVRSTAYALEVEARHS
jgi:membrane-bound serine protease (ClpP class)